MERDVFHRFYWFPWVLIIFPWDVASDEWRPTALPLHPPLNPSFHPIAERSHDYTDNVPHYRCSKAKSSLFFACF